MTPEGYAKLREELHNLRSVQRPAVIQAIAVAREHGDLKENAEYHAARDKQSFIEGRVKDLEAKLAGLQKPRGWGLFLIKNMVDDMRTHTTETHHTIELVMRLGEKGAAS